MKNRKINKNFVKDKVFKYGFGFSLIEHAKFNKKIRGAILKNGKSDFSYKIMDEVIFQMKNYFDSGFKYPYYMAIETLVPYVTSGIKHHGSTARVLPIVINKKKRHNLMLNWLIRSLKRKSSNVLEIKVDDLIDNFIDSSLNKGYAVKLKNDNLDKVFENMYVLKIFKKISQERRENRKLTFREKIDIRKNYEENQLFKERFRSVESKLMYEYLKERLKKKDFILLKMIEKIFFKKEESKKLLELYKMQSYKKWGKIFKKIKNKDMKIRGRKFYIIRNKLFLIHKIFIYNKFIRLYKKLKKRYKINNYESFLSILKSMKNKKNKKKILKFFKKSKYQYWKKYFFLNKKNKNKIKKI